VPFLIVQEKHGGDLEAAAERVEHAVGDVAFGEAGLRGFGAVDGDFVLRVIERLLHVRVGDAGGPGGVRRGFCRLRGDSLPCPNLRSECPRERGRAEIQDLGGDVGGEKIKSGAGEIARATVCGVGACRRRWGDDFR